MDNKGLRITRNGLNGLKVTPAYVSTTSQLNMDAQLRRGPHWISDNKDRLRCCRCMTSESIVQCTLKLHKMRINLKTVISRQRNELSRLLVGICLFLFTCHVIDIFGKFRLFYPF